MRLLSSLVRCTFIFLGRGSGLSRFTYELMQAAVGIPELDARLVVSQQNQMTAIAEAFSDRTLVVPTFDLGFSPAIVTGAWRARRKILRFIAAHRSELVVTLMPHVWSPLMVGGIKRLGARYATIVHDAAAHPGDPTAAVNTWLMYDALQADRVITLSRSVSERLIGRHRFPPNTIVPLFHPDLQFGAALANRELPLHRPLRLLFFGRIMKYKGLSLFLDAVELVREEGLAVEIGVFGAGDIAPEHERLQRLGAEVENRWIADAEVPGIMARYDVMVCSHIEASQSGVAATAFGALMPVVALPVGGLPEQVITGRTGILASHTSPQALADAIMRLAKEPRLFRDIVDMLRARRSCRSMSLFVDKLLSDLELNSRPSEGASHQAFSRRQSQSARDV